jgi:quinoprotein glucose dehydrogenase
VATCCASCSSMFKSLSKCLLSIAVLTAGLLVQPIRGAEFVKQDPNIPMVAPASDEGERAMKRFRIPKGFKVELFAAEPMLANPVCFTIDEKGRFYVAETFRLHAGVTDIRGHMSWLDTELASKSVEERVAYMKKFEGPKIREYTNETDRVRLIEDTDGDGKADKATVFSDGYSGIADGIGAGLLARKGDVYFANIPNLWLLRDNNGDGKADVKKSLSYGYGVRVGFLGHDLHGLRMGPDGKLYFSIGDRGAHVQLANGKVVENLETGAIYRCKQDGSDLEIYASGVRNPQELVFDQYGNLWTGDNNSDGGDPARWVYVVEGGDSGWRVGWQFITAPNARGPWLAEKMCYPQFEGQAAFIIPPIALIANGPSGLAYNPGIGMPDRYKEHFFLCDFRGSTGSGIHSFAVKPKGAGFEMIDRSEFVWDVLVTDGDFGYDGCFYLTDWVNGWNKTGKGRIYRVYDPEAIKSPAVAETKKLMAGGFSKRSNEELGQLLANPDMRLRQEAQFALVDREGKAFRILADNAAKNQNQLARLHGIWGMGQIAESGGGSVRMAVKALLALLDDADAEVRAQAAKVLGQAKAAEAYSSFTKLLRDPQERPRFFAAIGLGRLGKKEAVPALLEMLRANDNKDRYLRHAGVMGLTGCADPATLQSLAKDSSAGVRMAAVIALRRLERPEISTFLKDSDPYIVAEAVRAITDQPISVALPQVAALLQDPGKIETFPAGDEKSPGPRNGLIRRVLNANFRVGTKENASALANFAAHSTAADVLRAEAITSLGEWEKPGGRDHVTGLWRPLPTRDSKIAATALQAHLPALLASTSSSIKVSTTKVAASLGIKGGASGAYELLADAKQPSNVRVEALRSLSTLKDSRLEDAVKLALRDTDETLRTEASRIQARLKPRDAASQIKAVLENGGVREKQSAFATLAAMPGAAADNILSDWLDKVAARQAPPELTLDILDAAAQRQTPTIKTKLQKYETSRPAEDNLRAYRECLSGGNAEEGRKIFLERADVSCVRCHKINGEGGEVGPELTGIAKRQNREYILESIIYPNAKIAPGFESVLVTMNNGTAYAGTVKKDDASVLEINSPEDGILKLNKADIKTRERGLSGMPEELRQIMTKQDIRNLVEFLSGLKQGP